MTTATFLMPELRGGDSNARIVVSFGSQNQTFSYQYKENPSLTAKGFQRTSSFLRYGPKKFNIILNVMI